jgi:hypothetical protein
MQMTGHKTRSVFMRYDIVSESDLDETAVKLNVALNALGQNRDSRAIRTHHA